MKKKVHVSVFIILISCIIRVRCTFVSQSKSCNKLRLTYKLHGKGQGSIADFDVTSTIRHRGRVAYDGTDFAGFQRQGEKKRTVQGDLEEVLSRRFNRHVKVLGAGRTDAGVHAKGQAFHFDLLPNECLDLNKLEYSMNRMLSSDVRVWNVCIAPMPKQLPHGIFKWSVMYDAQSKVYVYRISAGSDNVMNPLERYNRWHIDDSSLDIDKLGKVLNHYKGTHDFRAFAGRIESNEKKSGKSMSTIRTVYNAELVNEGNGNYRIEFLLKGAKIQ